MTVQEKYTLNKITIWERFYPPSSDGKSAAAYSHNHIEDGWNKELKPISCDPLVTKNWNGFDWRKTFAYLVDGSVQKVKVVGEK